jgi:hypothetical protein
VTEKMFFAYLRNISLAALLLGAQAHVHTDSTVPFSLPDDLYAPVAAHTHIHTTDDQESHKYSCVLLRTPSSYVSPQLEDKVADTDADETASTRDVIQKAVLNLASVHNNSCAVLKKGPGDYDYHVCPGGEIRQVSSTLGNFKLGASGM